MIKPMPLKAITASFWIVGALMAPGAVHAQLFGDDEARKAIIDLRERVEVQRKQTESRLDRMAQEFARMNDESGAPTRRALLDMGNQLEGLRQDIARLRGQSEQLARDVADLQRQQKDTLVAFDERLRQLEPSTVTVDGQEFRVRPEEKQEFEAALALVRKASFAQAATAFASFIKRYPQSGYQPVAHFWQGNAEYAASDFKGAIEAYQRMLQLAPNHLRVPEAKLAIGNCQIELKDTKAARRTLEELVKSHPQAEAAVTAKERLGRLR